MPYNQNGQMHDGCAPRWDDRRLALDWSAWDRRFGPLLDGSAFADLPRKGVPVECFYLPLHENWPSPMEGNYNGDYWADRAFPESYRRAFVAASRQIAEHFQAKGWTETLFQGFLNNKNNFKARGWSRGSSPWLLDEPANFQDYWALRYFARAFHEGINQAAGSPAERRGRDPPWPRLVFRADISRPQWRRDSLDGLLDYHVVGSAMRSYPRLVFDRKRTFGEIVLEYGSTNPVEGSNVQPVGVVPGCLVAGGRRRPPLADDRQRRLVEAGRRAVALLSGTRPRAGGAGRSGPGVIPSIRLKAYRRGQQDVEYLTLWSQLHNEPRWAVGQQVRAALEAGRHAPGHGLHRRRGRRPDRLRPAPPAGPLGLAGRDRRGPLAGPSRAQRASSSTSAPRAATRSTCRRPRSRAARRPVVGPDEVAAGCRGDHRDTRRTNSGMPMAISGKGVISGKGSGAKNWNRLLTPLIS